MAISLGIYPIFSQTHKCILKPQTIYACFPCCFVSRFEEKKKTFLVLWFLRDHTVAKWSWNVFPVSWSSFLMFLPKFHCFTKWVVQPYSPAETSAKERANIQHSWRTTSNCPIILGRKSTNHLKQKTSLDDVVLLGTSSPETPWVSHGFTMKYGAFRFRAFNQSILNSLVMIPPTIVKIPWNPLRSPHSSGWQRPSTAAWPKCNPAITEL